jgi:hypothetical protein
MLDPLLYAALGAPVFGVAGLGCSALLPRVLHLRRLLPNAAVSFCRERSLWSVSSGSNDATPATLRDARLARPVGEEEGGPVSTTAAVQEPI